LDTTVPIYFFSIYKTTFGKTKMLPQSNDAHFQTFHFSAPKQSQFPRN